jgi:hypothetical protein
MRRLVELVLGGLPATPAATRAIAATMADWQHEAEKAGTATRRIRVATVGVLSVARVLIVSGIKEMPGAWSAPFLWRTALMSCVILLWAIWHDPPLRFVNVLGTRDLIILAVFRAAPAAVMLLPLAAFLSEALGSRDRVGPSTGALAAMMLVAALAAMLSPEFVHYQRHATWEHFANGATPAPVAPPSLVRLLSGGPTVALPPTRWMWFGALALWLAIATFSSSVLAYQARKRGSLGGWLVAMTPFASVFLATWIVWIVVRVFGPLAVRPEVFALFPLVSQFLTLFSLTMLPLVLAGYLARQTRRREANFGSVVKA